MNRRLSLLGRLLLAFASVVIGAGGAAAQDFPTRTVTMIVPVPPGSILDTLARLTGAELQKRWGQAVVADNRAGASGQIGTNMLMKSAPDGHTLLAGSNGQVIGGIFSKSVSFEPYKDVAPIMGMLYSPWFLLSSTAIPPRTAKEFVAYLQANPGKMNFGVTQGLGAHLDTIELAKRMRVDAAMIPYSGLAPMTKALLANEVQAYMGTSIGVQQNVDAGKMAALMVFSPKRSPALPNVPTIKEALGMDIDSGPVFGFFTVVGTPDPLIERLYKVLADIATTTEVGTKFQSQGYELRVTSPKEFGETLRSELARARETAKASNIQPQ